ncbi:copper homeostasis protein CutC [Agromyces intestinalis]|uniref:PF03932 family protein CutC n=1 Tax=Agromyces intestinalis TaxID=2592652 RepID=A0A5C1YLI5_9MICO|nr:copper homeostasis protein CutC [Agromyces intestinalis]QEO15672.1 copper homeostasis protein CutC [Agromyces intestinalis]
MPTPLQVEIAVQDAAGARIALAAGAARVELCQALGLGGLTPSAGLVAAAVEAAAAVRVAGFVHVLVRPRGGGFVYDADEADLIERDIRECVRLGADGVVIGALEASGGVDLDLIARFVDAAGDLEVTVHRAVDAATDPVAAVASLAGTGVRRVLTSGGAADCRSGLDGLAAMRAAVGDGLEVMAGGGLRIDDVAVLARLGLDAVHLSARRQVVAGASGPGGGVDGYDATDAGLVAAAVAAARAARASSAAVVAIGEEHATPASTAR